MKIILSGCTGFIGGETLRQAVRSPDITSIVVLSRRKLEDPEAVKSPKVKTVIINDFLNYSEDVVKEIQGAEAAIWSGLSTSVRLSPDGQYSGPLERTSSRTRRNSPQCSLGLPSQRRRSVPLRLRQIYRRVRIFGS